MKGGEKERNRGKERKKGGEERGRARKRKRMKCSGILIFFVTV